MSEHPHDVTDRTAARIACILREGCNSASVCRRYNVCQEAWIAVSPATRVRVEPLPGAPSDHTFVADDGTTRPAYYGYGVQPWDTIKTMEWAHHFAAGNVIKYLRRTKDVEDSQRKAIWYYRELAKMAVADSGPGWSDASLVLCQLIHELTHVELALVRAS